MTDPKIYEPVASIKNSEFYDIIKRIGKKGFLKEGLDFDGEGYNGRIRIVFYYNGEWSKPNFLVNFVFNEDTEFSSQIEFYGGDNKIPETLKHRLEGLLELDLMEVVPEKVLA